MVIVKCAIEKLRLGRRITIMKDVKRGIRNHHDGMVDALKS